MSIDKTLEERGSNYGMFETQARLSQKLKEEMCLHENFFLMSPHQREALEMIQHKIARIVNGDPNYKDSWKDIAGYATLIEKTL